MSETTVLNPAAASPVATQTPETEPQKTDPVAPATEPAKPADPMASKFAALAKKERQARLLQSQAKAQADALAKREAEIARREKEWDEEFRRNPLAALKKRNLTYQDITNAALNDDKFDPATEVKSVKDEIERLRQEQAEKERKAQEDAKAQQAQAEAQAVEAFKERIGQHIESNGEKYELTNLYDASELVFQTVEEHFARTKKVLSLDEACGLVESYLESEIERTAKQSKKFQSKYGQPKPVEEKKPAPSKTDTTLSNHLNAPTSPSLLSPANEAERMKRALAALGN
jgi:hypothetical protein